MRRGRITVGSSEVGTFQVDGDGIQVNFYQDAVICLHKKANVNLIDCTLEEAIDRVSQANLTLCLDYPSVYSAGVKHPTLYQDHKA